MSTPEERTAHPFYMYDEMLAQPDALTEALVGDDDQRDHIARELAGTHNRTDVIAGPVGIPLPTFVGRGKVWLTGCGTAYHAALIGADWLRHLTHGAIDAQAVEAFEFAHYSVPGGRAHDATVLLSQSGTPTAIIAAAEFAKIEGMYTVALSAQAESPLAERADETLITLTTPARAATYTISHIAMLGALADLANRCAEHLDRASDDVKDAIAALPQSVQSMLDAEAAIQGIVDELSGITKFIYGGGGPNWPTALEGALKIREAAYVTATGMPMEEIIHGPLGSIDDQTALILIAPRGPARDRAIDIVRAAQQVGAATVVIGSADDSELSMLAGRYISLPDGLELFSVVPATVVVQQFAYWFSMQRGGNPDRIRYDQPRWAAARAQYTR